MDSWSIVATGELRELTNQEETEFDPAVINRCFAPIRIFDKAVEEMEITIVILEIETITGRTAVDEPFTDEANLNGNDT